MTGIEWVGLVVYGAMLYLAGFACGFMFRNYLGGQVMLERIQRARRHIRGNSLMLIIVSLSFVVSAATWIISDRRDDQTLACFQAYLDADRAASAPRVEAIEQRDAAVNRVLFAAADVLLREPTAEARLEVVAAFENYLDTADELEQAREDNPYPDPPKELCADE